MADGVIPVHGQRPVRWVPEQGSRARVCDRCTEKKIKCDMNRPRCSACDRSKQTCTFSRTRKRPGPPKGAQRQSNGVSEPNCFNESSSAACRYSHCAPISQPLPDVHNFSSFADSLTQATRPDFFGTPEFLDIRCSLFHSKSRNDLAQFFTCTVNVCFPLFQSDTFSKVLEIEHVHHLPSVIYGISAGLIGNPNMRAEPDVDNELRQWVHTQQIKANSIIDPKALYEWQTACLLAWYGFHQRLGTEDETHLVITSLTRKAYHFGLHQIDGPENRGCYGWDLLDESSLEDWRRVWWCVYILDSYSSFSTATPTQVETESIQTALPIDPAAISRTHTEHGRIFLPPKLEGLPAVTQNIGNGVVDKGFGLHMAVNTLLKAAVTIHRLSKQSAGSYISGRISALGDHLSALQLTLPHYYMRPVPDIIRGEPPPGSNTRLQTQLKFHSIRLVLGICDIRMNRSRWFSRWQENLETCYRMFEVIQQWDSQSSLTVDPAICFIVASLLVMLHLHSHSSANSNEALLAQLTRRKEVVRLFLQNYASSWRLPRFLLDCCDTFMRKVSGSLSAEDIVRISDHFQGPLHQKWLSFLSPSPETPEFIDFDNLIHFDLDASIEDMFSFHESEQIPNFD
ncbi:hypothetical protein BJX96DRAFT_143053 [Aspergillus floccosus]